MPRARRGNKRLLKRKRILSLAKGFYLTKSKLYRQARESVQRALKFAYVGRKIKKRDFRSLWIVRIGAATKAQGLSYSRFMHGLKLSSINLDRKMLADLAVNDLATFTELVSTAKTSLTREKEMLEKISAVQGVKTASKKDGRYSTLRLNK
ncbi:MAG: 50S ribosomal protein L20 [Blastocatellia bacterium]